MRISVLTAVLLCAGTCYGQPQADAAATPTQKIFPKTIGLVNRAKERARTTNADENRAKALIAQGLGSNLLEWAAYLADPGMLAIRPFLSAAEQKRIDKQVGSGASSTGTTSLVSKGSVPALLGLAVENGAATQETSGTTITFRANPLGIIKALVKQDYLASGPTKIILPDSRTKSIRLEESDVWYKILSKASLSVSFDTSKGPDSGTFTAERSQLTGYSGHYDIINHRDPRDPRYLRLWNELRDDAGEKLANALTVFAAAINKMEGYDNWLIETSGELFAVSSPADIETKLIVRAEALRTLVTGHPEVLAVITSQVIPAANEYATSRVDLLNQVSKSFTLAFDYSNTRQVVTLGNTDGGMITLPAGVTNGLPNLGNFLLTAAGRFIGQSEITANLSGTRFNGRRVGPNIGRWRDIQAGFQIDVPLPEIKQVGKSTLTFSYLYLNLLEEPLGAKILVNDVEVSRKGIINFGQTKLDFPIGSTGMHIPIAMTFSNRTELIKESDVRGNIGITFDLDKIFAKKQ
jgi:hypothetical protein